MNKVHTAIAGVALGVAIVFAGSACGDDTEKPVAATTAFGLAPAEQVNDTPEPRSVYGMYMDQLASIDDMPVMDSTKAVAAGFKICGYIDSGYSQQSIILGIQQDNPELDWNLSLAVINAAEAYLCGVGK